MKPCRLLLCVWFFLALAPPVDAGPQQRVARFSRPGPPVLHTSSLFGRHVALDGDWAVVGVDGDLLGDPRDYVLVYRRVAGVWSRHQQLGPFPDAIARDIDDIALDGPWLILMHGAAIGAASLFRLEGPAWEPSGRVQAGLTGGFNRVAIWGERLFAASVGEDTFGTNSGGVYVYGFDGSAWGLEDHLYSPDAAFGQRFAYDLALDERGRLFVSEPYRPSTLGAIDAGVVHVFEESGGRYVTTALIEVGDEADAFLGTDLVAEADRLYAQYRFGARLAEFTRSATGVWERTEIVVPAFGLFFDTVVEGGALVVSGNNANPLRYGLHVYEELGGTWSLADFLEVEDDWKQESGATLFGVEAALQGGTLVVSDAVARVPETSSPGTVWVVDFEPSTRSVLARSREERSGPVTPGARFRSKSR